MPTWEDVKNWARQRALRRQLNSLEADIARTEAEMAALRDDLERLVALAKTTYPEDAAGAEAEDDVAVEALT